MNLLIELKQSQRQLKAWKLQPHQITATFGSSRKAELIGPSNYLSGIEGVFEYRDGKWFYVNLNLKREDGEQELKSQDQISFGQGELHFQIYGDRAPLLPALEKTGESQSSDRKPYQLVTVSYGDQLLRSKILNATQSFSIRSTGTTTQLPWSAQEGFKRTQVGEYTVMQKTVHLSRQDALRQRFSFGRMDGGSRAILGAAIFGVMLVGGMFLLSPESRDAREVALDSTPPMTKPAEVVLPRKKERTDGMKPMASAPAASEKPTTPSVKNLASSRFSQLIGKVSRTSARSANVVVSSGVTAGTAPSGRGLAAVGSASTSNTDWSQTGASKGFRVGTAGVGGGNALSGSGTLDSGKVGRGGAELIEDESEIVGGLDREVIAEVIRKNLGQILFCYERQLSAQPDLFGKVTVKFAIDAKGKVDTQSVAESSLKSKSVEGCMLQQIRGWKFPEPKGGTKVMVTYPFLFKSNK